MKRIISISFIIFTAFLLVGCNFGEEDTPDPSEMITITHELGETDVKQNPEKVVVFDFGVLDSLDALDIEVTGVPKANLPGYLDKFEDDAYENIGSLKEPDFEKISEIDPDVIIISGRQADQYDELNKLGPTIFLGVDTTRYMDSFQENSEVIGELFDQEEEIAKRLTDIEEQIEQLKEKAQSIDQKSLIILANDDKISAYGENSRFGIIHDVFGIEAADDNIDAATHGMNISFEYIVDIDPDLLYVIDRSAAIGEEPAAKNIVENKLMEQTKAMQNEAITYLNPDVWYLSGGGLISVQEMIDEIDASLD